MTAIRRHRMRPTRLRRARRAGVGLAPTLGLAPDLAIASLRNLSQRGGRVRRQGKFSYMDVTEAVGRRMSVRAFRPDPVPRSLVREILQLAHGAPSGGNLQPWRGYQPAGGLRGARRRRVAAH